MKIQIILGSKSDMQVAEKIKNTLKDFSVVYDIKVASAHRTPEYLKELVEKNDSDVFIGVAGLSAALPGSIAAHTTKPVIGVPISGKVNFDALLSIVQMPPGIPVAAVGLDRGDNAALLAVQILSLKDEKLQIEMLNYRKKIKNEIISDK